VRKLFQLSELKGLISQTDLQMKGMSTMGVIHFLNNKTRAAVIMSCLFKILIQI